MRHVVTTAIGFAALFSSTHLIAQHAPSKALVEKTPIIGPPAIQKFPRQKFFFVTGTGSQKTIPDAVKGLMPRLTSAAKEAGLVVTGPMVIVFHRITPNPEAPVDFEMGYICDEATRDAGEAQIGVLKPATCATINYTGQITGIAKAYETLFPAIYAAGKTPTPEIRQLLLYFEHERSENSLSQIQVVIQ